MQIELLWFDGCPNYEEAEQMVIDVLQELGADSNFIRIKVADEFAAEALRFPGSPTIRVDGRDIESGWTDSGEYALRCRVYQTSRGLRGLPERESIIDAIRAGIAFR